jgi:PPOX class probable F420-dependent enzyme
VPTLTAGQAAFLHEEPNLAVVAALREDGKPHQTPVWVDWVDEHVVLNLNNFRAKLEHLRHDPRVSVLVLDRNNPFRWIAIEGQVDEITTDGGFEHIVRQAGVYLGRSEYTLQEGEERILVKIEPERIEPHGVE